MRPGLFPSQQRALRRAFKKADAFDHFRQRTRRAFVGLSLLAVATGVGGFVFGRRRGAVDEPDEAASLIDRHRALATAPLERLRAAQLVFLASMEQSPGDEEFWVGFERLATHALSQPGNDEILRRLRITARSVPVPNGYEWVVQRLIGK